MHEKGAKILQIVQIRQSNGFGIARPSFLQGNENCVAPDERAHAKLREFFHLWLKLDPAPDVAKDADRFPGFDPAVVADLRTSLDLSLDDAAWGKDSDFRRLLLADLPD